MQPPGGSVRPFPLFLTLFLLFGCTRMPGPVSVMTTGEPFPANTILDTRTGQPITFDALLDDLAAVRVVYVGETHSDRTHHLVQERVIAALHDRHAALSVGMEMFDHRYDPVLAQWSAGDLDRAALLERTHWNVRQAGWGFDFDLYAPIFDTIQNRRIPLVGLNVPFWIPPKISASGLANLLPDERRLLADRIDTSHAAHRAYVESVFSAFPHHQVQSFDYFYQAQCAWEDTMAESIARKLTRGPMVVVIGNGHIQYKYGVPDRAHERRPVPFRTVYLVSVGTPIDPLVADYIWVTP